MPRLLPCENLRFALLPMVLLALNNAAFAGQKRLSSATYQSLNVAVVLEAAVVLGYYAVSSVTRPRAAGSGLSLQLLLRLLLRGLQFAAGCTGLYLGKSYRPAAKAA